MITPTDARKRSIRRVVPLLQLAMAMVTLATCTTATPAARSGRAVVSQYSGWTIRVAPSLADRWRAGVRVWPPEVDPQSHGGIMLYFNESASSETAIVSAATAFARHYIDGNRRTD